MTDPKDRECKCPQLNYCACALKLAESNGRRIERERILVMLRSDETTIEFTADCSIDQSWQSQLADYLESRLGKE